MLCEVKWLRVTLFVGYCVPQSLGPQLDLSVVDTPLAFAQSGLVGKSVKFLQAARRPVIWVHVPLLKYLIMSLKHDEGQGFILLVGHTRNVTVLSAEL